MRLLFERFIYIITILTLILSFFVISPVINIILLCTAVIYLSIGWYILNKNYEKAFDGVLFLFGYSFSSIIVAYLFFIKNYPLKELILYGAIGFLIISNVVLFSIKKSKHKSDYELIIKSLLLLILGVILFLNLLGQ